MHDGPLVNRHKDTTGQPINWINMKVMKYSPDANGKLMCFISFNEDGSPQRLNLRRKRKGRTSDWILPQLEDGPRKLPPKKVKDLMNLLPFTSAGSRHF